MAHKEKKVVPLAPEPPMAEPEAPAMPSTPPPAEGGEATAESPAAASPPEAVMAVVEPTPMVVSEAFEEKQVQVVPRKTLQSCRIGVNYYSFVKGQPTRVPASVRAHLVEKGVL